MEDVGATLHDADVVVGRVGALAVLDRVGEAVGELPLVAQQVGFDELHHAVVLDEAVLQRCACQHDATLGVDAIHGLGCNCRIKSSICSFKPVVQNECGSRSECLTFPFYVIWYLVFGL